MHQTPAAGDAQAMPLPASATNGQSVDSPIQREVSRPVESHAEFGLLWRLRYRLLRSSLRQLAATAQFRLGLAVALAVIFWTGMYVLTHEGFLFLHNELGSMSAQAEPMVFELFYASLLMMLIFSSGIILYGGLYSTRETAFLLSTPLRAQIVFAYKFQEAVLLSSWGFVLLGSPLMVAYGVVVGAPWYYFVLLLPYVVAFVFIPAGLGAIACLLIVRYLTRFRKQTLVVLCFLLAGTAVYFGWAVISGGETNLLSRRWFDDVSRQLGGAHNRLLPSWWLSSGLMEASRSDGRSLDYQPWAQSLLFLATLIANALFIRQVAMWLAGRILFESYSRLQTTGASARHAGVATIDRVVSTVIRPLRATTRLLLLKDFRIFRRDPAQWTQFLIFFALLMLYFTSVQRINYGKQYTVWVNIVSFLNLAVVGLILSTFTTRFIYPLISLEGRRFWLLGLLPVDRDTILWGKFLFAAIGSTVPCAVLILLSDVMLRVAPLVLLVHQVACVLLCIGLSAIAVGLGAMMPDLREMNPSKIAAGFGGTLNLVLSAFYVVIIVALTAIPCYRYIEATQQGSDAALHLDTLRWWVTAGCATALLFGIASTVLPMWIGLRAFRRLEF